MTVGSALTCVDLKAEDAYRHRRYCRTIFRAAYEEFRELAASRASVPATDYEQLILLAGDRNGAFPAKVVSASDWLMDFDRAGRHVLRVLHAEREIFILHYLLGYAAEATMSRLGIPGWRSWQEVNKLIAERVGGELLRRELWPVHDRILRRGYLD